MNKMKPTLAKAFIISSFFLGMTLLAIKYVGAPIQITDTDPRLMVNGCLWVSECRVKCPTESFRNKITYLLTGDCGLNHTGLTR